MKTSLHLKQAQHLKLTPQLQQAIRLLQLSSMEISQEVARMLDENPMLERSDEYGSFNPSPTPARAETSSGDTPETPNDQDNAGSEPAEDEWARQDMDWGDSGSYSSHGEDRDDDDDNPAGHRRDMAEESPTLREHLLWQLNVSQIDARDREIISLLIDALDNNGYLSQPLEEIAEMLQPESGVTLDDLETALVQLQHLDKPGIGARDLSECLALQIKALPEDIPCRGLALRLVTDHLDLLGAHDFARLKKALHCKEAELRTVQTIITHLQPRPAAEFENRTADYVIPDVVVDKHRGEWRVRLNQEAMPRLRINQLYASILQQRGGKSEQQLAGQLQEARWFIKNIHQRFETILRVSQAIVERQRHFFEHGDIAMRPLVLREIADNLQLHESTISRVTTQKFMLTPRGLFELKHFFGSGVSTENGGTCSSTAIRALIKQLIHQEDAHHPLSDSRLAEILSQQGIQVARRTVAKYREVMNILPVNLRHTL